MDRDTLKLKRGQAFVRFLKKTGIGVTDVARKIEDAELDFTKWRARLQNYVVRGNGEVPNLLPDELAKRIAKAFGVDAQDLLVDTLDEEEMRATDKLGREKKQRATSRKARKASKKEKVTTRRAVPEGAKPMSFPHSVRFHGQISIPALHVEDYVVELDVEEADDMKFTVRVLSSIPAEAADILHALGNT